MPPSHASGAVSPVMMHMVTMNAPKKNSAKPSENKKNLAIKASKVSVSGVATLDSVAVEHSSVKNQGLPIYTGKIRAMVQCIKTFPSKISDLDFTRGNPNSSFPVPYQALSQCSVTIHMMKADATMKASTPSSKYSSALASLGDLMRSSKSSMGNSIG
jgi:hypothetical protein